MLHTKFMVEHTHITSDLWRKPWAKSDPYHPLWCHLLDAAAVCQALLPSFGPIGSLSSELVMYIVAMHDIGKADPAFQVKSPEHASWMSENGFPDWIGGPTKGFRHERRSFEWLLTELKQGRFDPTPRTIAHAVRGHHADFGAKAYAENEPQAAPWRNLRRQMDYVVRETIGITEVHCAPFANESAVGLRLAGLVVLSDWIASNDKTYDYVSLQREHGQGQPLKYFEAARTEALRAVRDVGFGPLRKIVVSSPPRFADLWDFKDGQLRPIQTALQSKCAEGIDPGLVIIEAPMGEGKTEAAIFLATTWQKDGCYIALPTTATSNQMHRRYTDFLSRVAKERQPLLVHGMSWLMDNTSFQSDANTEGDDPQVTDHSQSWFRNAKRALLASDGVGTVDQALKAALNVRHGFLRLTGLSRKVLIIDEVHAYDAYMGTILERLLTWCRALEIPVILLSATLSASQKQQLVQAYQGESQSCEMGQHDAYPLITVAPRIGSAYQVLVPNQESRGKAIKLRKHFGTLGKPKTVAQLARDAVQQGGCCCILANTVGSAQAIYRELQADCSPDTELILFHARFPAGARNAIEKNVVELFGKDAGLAGNRARPERAIVVATQVIEQSIDVDFDVLFSEVAPIDLLLQRCGRMHRHERGTRPTGPDAVLHVLMPPEGDYDFGSSAAKESHGKWRGVYDRELLLRTVVLLGDTGEISLPRDFRPLVEGCYGNQMPNADEEVRKLMDDAAVDRKRRRNGSKNAADLYLIAPPNEKEFNYPNNADTASFEEDEDGEHTSFFYAQTREGDDNRQVLLVRDPAHYAAICRGIEDPKYYPGLDTLRAIYRQQVKIAGWWLAGAEPQEGYEWCQSVPKWLGHQSVLFMPDGVWTGGRKSKDGRPAQPFTIVNDSQLGVLYQTIQKENT